MSEESGVRVRGIERKPDLLAVNMGRLTTDVLREMGWLDDSLNDPITRACGVDEMGPLLAAHARTRITKLLADHAMTPEDFEQELRLRCNDKWLWDSGLLGIASYIMGEG